MEENLATLRLSLLLNSSLAALKSSSPLSATDARLAIKQASRAIEMDGNGEREQGKKALSEGEKAKCLYRRALGLKVVKEDDKAIKDLEAAKVLAPADAAIISE
jgi:peptidyl-prolyl isomerase D